MSDMVHPEGSSMSVLARPRRRRWKLVVLSVLLLVCGAVLGSALTVVVLLRQVQGRIQHPEAFAVQLAHRLQRRLDLSDEQAEQVERIIRLRQVEIRKIRAEFQPRFEEQLDQIGDEVAGVLTSDQATEWRRLLAEKRRLWLPPLPVSASAPSSAGP